MESKIIHGDCINIQDWVEPCSVDLIITSPPYGTQRKNQYDSVTVSEYEDFLVPRCAAFFKVLKDSGSFILNIKECIIDGERSDYVMKLVLALRDNGWKLIDEYIWVKSNPVPGNFGNRFKDGWEHIFHFSKNLEIKINKDSVKVIPSKYTVRNKMSEMKNYPNGKPLEISRTGSSVSRRRNKMWDIKSAYPSNVLDIKLGSPAKNKFHAAVFPDDLPKFFISLLTDENDYVVDPFSGSGTTVRVANMMNRIGIGIDTKKEYCEFSQKLISSQTALI